MTAKQEKFNAEVANQLSELYEWHGELKRKSDWQEEKYKEVDKRLLAFFEDFHNIRSIVMENQKDLQRLTSNKYVELLRERSKESEKRIAKIKKEMYQIMTPKMKEELGKKRARK